MQRLGLFEFVQGLLIVRRPHLVVLLMSFATTSLCAQSGVITGTVVADTTERPIAGATITLPGLKRSVLANYAGEFRFRDLAPGRYAIEIRHLGFAPLTDTVVVVAGQVVDREYALTTQALQLDSVKVTTAARPLNPLLVEFDNRRRANVGGTFLTDSLLRRDGDGRMSFANFLSGHLPGLSVVEKKGLEGSTYLSSHRGSCTGRTFSCATSTVCMPAMYLDGVATYIPGRGQEVPDLENYRAEDFGAVEWYSGLGEVPPQYNTTGSNCGVLLLWRRNKGG